MLKTLLGCFAVVMVAAASVACSSDDGPGDGSSSGDSGVSSSGGAGGSSSGGAGGSSSSGGGSSSGGAGGSSSSGGVSGCSTYTDRTADTEVELTWDFSIETAPERCVRIKVGSQVTWNGNLATHPLSATTTPSPIAQTTSGDSVSFTFAEAGEYGYVCDRHPSMVGAIEVVP